MTEPATDSSRNTILRRICTIQVGLLVAATGLLFVMMSRQFGFFWHSFILGGLGASIALQRRLTKKNAEELDLLASERIAIDMPVLYGAVMAAVTYGLFMSNLVSGDPDGALLSSNVFPKFVVADLPLCSDPKPDRTEKLDEGETLEGVSERDRRKAAKKDRGVTWSEFFCLRPATTEDLGKLFVWCFLAGYSESFVTGLLSRLEQTGNRSETESLGKNSETEASPTQSDV